MAIVVAEGHRMDLGLRGYRYIEEDRGHRQNIGFLTTVFPLSMGLMQYLGGGVK
jgi:hypothetical protein